MRTETRQNTALFDLIWEQARGGCLCLNDWESTVSTDFEVTNFSKLAKTEPTNNEDG